MIRRFVLPLLGSGLLLAGSATGVLAKCEGPNPPDFCQQVVAFIDLGGGALTAGTATPVDVFVQKSEQAYPVQSVLLSFYNLADGTLVRATAERTSDPGRWRANVTLTAAGGWRADAVVVDLDGQTIVYRIEPTQVARAPLKPPTTPTTPTPPVTPTPPSVPALPIALLVAGLAAAVMAGAALRDRTRRRTGALASTASAGAARNPETT